MPTVTDSTVDPIQFAARSAAAKRAWETIRAKRSGVLPEVNPCCKVIADQLRECRRKLAEALEGRKSKPKTTTNVIKFRKTPRRMKIDISDEACLARYEIIRSKGGVKPLKEVLAAFGITGKGKKKPEPITVHPVESVCNYCNRNLPSGLSRRCSECDDLIRRKSGIWQTVNSQAMSYDEAMAAQAAKESPEPQPCCPEQEEAAS